MVWICILIFFLFAFAYITAWHLRPRGASRSPAILRAVRAIDLPYIKLGALICISLPPSASNAVVAVSPSSVCVCVWQWPMKWHPWWQHSTHRRDCQNDMNWMSKDGIITIYSWMNLKFHIFQAQICLQMAFFIKITNARLSRVTLLMRLNSIVLP